MAAPARIIGKFFELSLLGMVATGFGALLGTDAIERPFAIATVAALCIRAVMAIREVTFPVPRLLISALALLLVGGAGLDLLYGSQSIVQTMLHLVIGLAVVKVLTARTARDFNTVKLIAVAELLAAAYVSVSPIFFPLLGLFLLFAIMTWSSGEIVRSTRLLVTTSNSQTQKSITRGGLRAFPRRLAGLSAGLFIGILILTGGMFFVLPRAARGAMARVLPSRYHLSGFSDAVSLGEIGEIKQRDTPAMRVRAFPEGAFLPVYWRGLTLSQFDGKHWFNLSRSGQGLLAVDGVMSISHSGLRGVNVQYQVELNDVASGLLFFGGEPEVVNIDGVSQALRGRDGSIRVRSTGGILRYGVASVIVNQSAANGLAPPPLSSADRGEYLQLTRMDPRVPALAASMTVGAESAEGKANELQEHLRHDYGYTLEMPSKELADPLANFLFERKKGHCEYFASAMVVMLRELGIPARVVAGFQSGVYNPMTGWQVVRSSDAHSWVEAWFADRGWTTYDPTPSDPNAPSAELTSRLSMLLDAGDQFWQDWVVGYSFDRQLVLASRLQESGKVMGFDWVARLADQVRSGTLGRAYEIGIGLIVVMILCSLIWARSAMRWLGGHIRLRRAKQGIAHASDATVLYQQMLRNVEQRGYQKPPWLTPCEFVKVIPPSELAILVEDLTGAYNQVRFGGRPDAAPKMVQLLQRIEALQ